MITAANEVVNDPSSVGTALKTLTLRLRGSKTELEEMGEDVTGMATTTSQLQAKLLALTGGQVDIMLDENSFKNSTQILREMAAAWEDMTDIQRASALELMGGKRQANVLSALIQNFDTVEEAIETSANSAGSAMKENERYLDSIQGKIDQFNNAMQAMWSDTLDSDVVKKFIELGTALIKILDAVGPLNVAFVGLFAFLEKKYGLIGNLFKKDDSLEGLKKQLEKAKKDLEKASDADLRQGTNKTAEKRRNAEERVNILKQKVQEASEEAVLEGIDESFDPNKAKNKLKSKKRSRTMRINQLQAEGKTFDEIAADPKVQQYTKEIEEAEQALNEYNATMQRANATSQQASVTTQANTAATRANAASNNAAAAAETADAAATSGSAAAEVADTAATTGHTAATLADVWAEMTRTGATGASVLATMKQVIATKLASSALVQKGLAIMGVTAAEGASIPVTTMLAGGFVGLTASIWSAITAMWTFMTTTPIGWILLAVAAVVALGAAFAAMHKSAAELREELSGLKDEISGVKDEIDSLNSELETTKDRMAELLAKDSLTFTEQEELENLQKQNDLLEREIYLLEQREKRLQQQAQKTFDDLMKKELAGTERDLDEDGEKDDVFDRSLERKLKRYKNRLAKEEEATQELLAAEKELEDAQARGHAYDTYVATQKVHKATKKRNRKQKRLGNVTDKLDEELNQYLEDAEGIDYESADEQTRAYLDYIYNFEGRYNIASGDDQAKTVELKRIFNKSAMSGVKDEIDGLVEQLGKNPGDQTIIAQISEQCKLAESDLKAVGLSVEDAISYFTKLGTSASYNTIEGKVKEIDEATKRLKGALDQVDTSSAESIQQSLVDKGWINKNGKVLSDEIAEFFGGEGGGVSEQTREEIERLVKQLYDGKLSVEDALKSFKLFGVQSIIDIQVEEVKTNFKDVFVDLEDADGLVDTFNELGTAIGSAVGALEAFNQAQADVADKGFVSIQTALQLMEYTDDYSSVLQVVDGKLQLAANAEQNLIQARIDAIKISAQTAVADAQAAYDKAELAVQSYRSAMVEEASASTVATAWQKIVGVASGIKSVLENIWSGESISDLYKSGYESYLTSATGYEMQYDDAGLQALEDALTEANKKLTEAKGNAEIANTLTPENLENLYEPTDKNTEEEAANDAFQKAMDYWENRIGANQAKYEQLQNEIDLMEKKGQKADASFYQEQIALENERIWLLEQQKAEAEKFLATFTEGSDEWWEVANTLNDIESELDDVTASIVDLQDALGELNAYRFDEFNNRLDNLTSKLGTIRDLMAPNGEEDWFDDEGNWTDTGIAVAGTYLQELETYKQGYQRTMDELAKYEPAYAGNEDYYEALGIHSEQEWYDKTEELISQQYDFAESISDTEQSIVDMYESSIDAVEEYVDKLVDSYNDYIDSVKEALDAERDLYDFKKNVQKQAKDIAALERRIASLSGSTNAADIAERRKLEAQLYESRESLNDTYYDHAKNAQTEALDAEATAYEESMTSMVEGMRTSLTEATADMETFLNGVTVAVSMNAEAVLDKYRETNVYLDPALTNPWEHAKAQVGEYGDDANNLMDVWKADGYFADFKSKAGTNLSAPWDSGTSAANTFKSSVYTVMSDVVTNIESNVQKAQGLLSDLTADIKSTNIQLDGTVGASYSGSSGSGGGSTSGTSQPVVTTPKQLDNAILTKYKLTSAQVLALGYGPLSLSEFENLLKEYKIKYSSLYKQVANTRDIERLSKKVMYGDYVSGPMAIRQYAKGTYGTERDEWAITDEPQFGDELVLVPGKDGNLSFMRKGTSVVPADITKKLFELAQIPTSDLMNKNLTAVVPNITKNDFKNEFNFESLVHVDTVDSDTLPKLEKMVDKKIDDFSKALNYSLKRFAR